MAISFAQLQDLLKKEGYRYLIAPDQPLIRFTVAGRFGRYDIAIFLQEQGVFFQFRTIGYLRCPADHPNLKGVLQTLAAINYQMRYLKLGWDPASGEIAGYGDGWVMDNQVTQQQFHQMLGNFLPGIDNSYPRLKTALETGKDPGNQPPPAVPPQPPGAAPPTLPPDLRELLEKLERSEGKTPDRPAPGAQAEVTEI
jgi:hypothetical protein